eukprot:jgi/Phyca11/511609/fgenesh2_kg.PHYCAscaffold_91_\
MEKGPLPEVVFNPPTLGDEVIEMAGITFEEGYSDEEVDVVSSCSDDDDDDMDNSDKDDAGSEEEGT